MEHFNNSYNSKLKRELDEIEAKWTKRLRYSLSYCVPGLVRSGKELKCSDRYVVYDTNPDPACISDENMRTQRQHSVLFDFNSRQQLNTYSRYTLLVEFCFNSQQELEKERLPYNTIRSTHLSYPSVKPLNLMWGLQRTTSVFHAVTRTWKGGRGAIFYFAYYVYTNV